MPETSTRILTGIDQLQEWHWKILHFLGERGGFPTGPICRLVFDLPSDRKRSMLTRENLLQMESLGLVRHIFDTHQVLARPSGRHPILWIRTPKGTAALEALMHDARQKIMDAVKALRGTLGLTQTEFGGRVGKSLPTIQRWEGLRPPTGDALLQLQNLANTHRLYELAAVFRDAFSQIIDAFPAWPDFVAIAGIATEEECSSWDARKDRDRRKEEARKAEEALLSEETATI